MSLDKTLYVKVKLDDSGVQSQLNKLKSSLSSIQNVGGGKAAKEVNSLGDAFSSTVTKGLKLGAVALALGKIKDAAVACVKSASDLQEAMNISGTMFGYGTLSKWVDDVGSKFGIAATNAHTYAGTMASMLQSMGVSNTNFKEMSKNLTQLAGDFASFYNISSDDAFAKIRSGMAGQVRGLQTLGINMTQANLNAWLLSKGIHAQFNQLSQASQEMVRYNYLMEKSRHIQGDFAKTSGSWANQTRTLALQWSKLKSIIGSGLIQALTPVVQLLNTVLGLAVKAAQAIAAFFGWKMKVSESSGGGGGGSSGVGGLADDLDNTGKAANNAGKAANNASKGLGNTGKAAKNTTKAVKELKKELMGFDKINNLTKQDDSSGADTGGSGGGSGGGGSGGGGGDSGNHGGLDVGLERLDYSKVEDPLKNLIDLFSKLKPLISAFKEGFKEGFGDAGKYFDIIKEDAKRLKDAFKDLMMDPKVAKSFEDLAETAARSIGQIIGSIARVGLTLASAGFGGFVDGFIEKLDTLKKRIPIINNNIAGMFKGLGSISIDIADMIEVNYSKIRSIFKNVTKIIIEASSGIKTVASSIGNALISGIAKVIHDNKGKIATAIGNVLTGLDRTLDGIHKVLSGLFDGLIEAAENHLKPAIDAVFGFISKVVNGFLSVFNKIDFKSLIPPSVISLAKQIGSIFSDIFDVIKDIVKALTPVAKVIGTIVGAIVGSGIMTILQAIKIALQVISAIIIQLLAPIRAVIKVLKHIFDGDIFTTSAWEDILSPFKDAWETLGDTLSTIWGTIKDAWKFLWDSVKEIGSAAWEGIKGIFTGLGEWFSNLWSGIKETASKAWNGIKDVASAAWEGIKGVFSTVGEWFKSIWNGIVTVAKAIWNGYVAYLKAIWEAIKTVFAPVVNFFKGIWDKVTNAIKTAWNAIKTAASNLWSGIKTIFSPVVTWFKSKWGSVVNAIKTAWNTIKRTASNLWTGIKNIFNGVGTWFKGKWDAIYKAVKGVWDNIKKTASNLWTNIKNIFNNVGTWFRSKWNSAYTAVTGVFKNIGTFFSGIWSRIKNTFSRFGSSMGSAFSSAFKSGINGVISVIEGAVNSAINLINGAIRLINKIPGVSVGTVGHVSLPRLAKGGYIDREMIATIGEAGPEAVVPLSNTKADQLKPLANQLAIAMGNINNNRPTNITVEPTIEVQLNGDLNKFLSFAAVQNNTRNKMLGIGLNPA